MRSVFSALSNFIITGCRLKVLPRLLTFVNLVVLPLFFITFNIVSNALVISLPSLLSSSLLSRFPLLLSTLFLCYFISFYWSFAISVCLFSSLPNRDYLKLLIVTAFLNSSFSGKISSPPKNSYLPTFPDEKAKILAVYLPKSYWALFCSILLLIVLIFSLTVIL